LKNELKYANTEGWLAPIYEKDPEFAEGLEKIHDAICMADDIADRQMHPEHASGAVWLALIGMDILVTRPSYWPRMKEALRGILTAEKINLEFVPGRFDPEEDLKLCLTKASLIDFYFQAMCCLDPTVETEENREWLHRFKEYCLIIDDCDDILSGTFEDLRNCRRNYVVLKYYGEEFYFHWKHNKEELARKAAEIKAGMKIAPPLDARLMFFVTDPNAEQDSQSIVFDLEGKDANQSAE